MADIRVTLRNKANTLMDELEAKLKAQAHITDAEEIVQLVEKINNYFTILNEDEKEFVGAAAYAIRTKTRWD